MKIKTLGYIFSLCMLLVFASSCTEEERDLDYLNGIALPSQLNLQVVLAQDNSGTATLTPTATSASSFIIDFGDGTETVEVPVGESVLHVYSEGTFQAQITARNLKGETTTASQEVIVSFLPPENLEISISSVPGDSFSINLSATADLAVGFEAYFGDDPNETPTPFMLGETITHTYAAIGTYEVRVVAFSGGTQTIEATQMVTIVNPIVLPIDFESGTIIYEFGDFGGAVNTVIDNPDPSGMNTSPKVAEFFKEPGAEIFAGTVLQLGAPIDFSIFEAFQLKAWSPAAGITVKLKLENANDPGISAEIDATTTMTNTWETLFFDFSGANLTQEYSKVIVFFDFGNPGAGTTFYYDDIEQTVASGTPLVILPVDFENSAINYGLIDFEGNDSAIEDNPDASGINTSSKVVRVTKTMGAQFFAGTILPLDVPIDFSVTERLAIKTWSPKNNIPIRLKLENEDASEFVELDVNTTTINEWEELVWDFSGMTGGTDFVRVIIFFEFVVDLPGDGSTYYFDDIELDL